jgi:hypothetical protein
MMINLEEDNDPVKSPHLNVVALQTDASCSLLVHPLPTQLGYAWKASNLAYSTLAVTLVGGCIPLPVPYQVRPQLLLFGSQLPSSPFAQC